MDPVSRFVCGLPRGAGLCDLRLGVFDWFYRENYWLKVRVDDDGSLFWSASVGLEKHTGSVPSFDEVPPTIIELWRRIGERNVSEKPRSSQVASIESGGPDFA